MQVAQPEILRIHHDDGVHIGHIDPRFDDSGGDQHILFMIDKISNHPFQFLRIHLPVSHRYAHTRYLPLDKRFQLIDILDAVVHDKQLSIPVQLKIDRITHQLHIKRMYLGLYGITVGRRCSYGGEVARSHQGELQGAGNGGCRHGECIHIHLQLFEFFLDRHAEFLLLINNQQSQVFKFHIFSH